LSQPQVMPWILMVMGFPLREAAASL